MSRDRRNAFGIPQPPVTLGGLITASWPANRLSCGLEIGRPFPIKEAVRIESRGIDEIEVEELLCKSLFSGHRRGLQILVIASDEESVIILGNRSLIKAMISCPPMCITPAVSFKS